MLNTSQIKRVSGSGRRDGPIRTRRGSVGIRFLMFRKKSAFEGSGTGQAARSLDRANERTGNEGVTPRWKSGRRHSGIHRDEKNDNNSKSQLFFLNKKNVTPIFPTTLKKD